VPNYFKTFATNPFAIKFCFNYPIYDYSQNMNHALAFFSNDSFLGQDNLLLVNV